MATLVRQRGRGFFATHLIFFLRRQRASKPFSSREGLTGPTSSARFRRWSSMKCMPSLATIGNPDRILNWLTRETEATSQVISPSGPAANDVEVQLDYVGGIENAAIV